MFLGSRPAALTRGSAMSSSTASVSASRRIDCAAAGCATSESAARTARASLCRHVWCSAHEGIGSTRSRGQLRPLVVLGQLDAAGGRARAYGLSEHVLAAPSGRADPAVAGGHERSRRVPADRAHTSAWLTLLGMSTYPLYLIHYIVGATLMAMLIRAGWSPGLALVGSCLAMVACAIAITALVEAGPRRWIAAMIDAALAGRRATASGIAAAQKD